MKNGLIVNDCNFKNFPIDLLFTEFQYKIKFINCIFNSLDCYCICKTKKNFFIFENCKFNEFYLNNDQQFCDLFQLNNQMYFIHCIFSCNIHIGKSCVNNEIKFYNCKFNGIFSIDFKECLNIFQLTECIFIEKVFIKGYFQDNIYFNNSHFKDYVDFHACEFEKTASFYGVTFDKTPNFSQAVFKGNLNVVNTNLNFTFDDLQEKIKQEYKDFNKDKKEEYQKSLDKFANDFRDSFRTFKNALIKDNNFLEASNFHKYELYCKELELENKKVTTFKDIVDRYQLFFYRKLCDHHTDLLLNAKWLLYIVALYVLLLGKMIWVYPVLIIIFLASIYLCKIKNIWLNLSSITVLIAIVCCPKMIFGFTNLFTSNLNYWQNLITTVYVVVIGLVIFSLQKTARKNSIVPS
ncbi:pentapeptide repeat-containing protein [Campylobacter coli]|nr:pentapeptide repeat-containing protein [Campylobacter coli]